MNDADFEALARTAAAGLIERGVKPYTLETDMWLRMRALELAVDWSREPRPAPTSTLEQAKKFYDFLKGETSEQDLRRQDER